jgi:predicted nucleic acid-binding protein
MGKNYLLDTNVVLGLMDENFPASSRQYMASVLNKGINLSIISKIELLGFSRVEDVIEEFVSLATIIQLGENISNHTIAIRRHSKIKLPDAIIAATAIAGGMTLLTRNVADFRNIDGLSYLNPWELPENTN